ncbi:MAG: hypothetical protein K2J80_14525 [Oscillospiraceae bacterium]|nr:hypothetical protein [Oscillospiraceae bacterium]
MFKLLSLASAVITAILFWTGFYTEIHTMPVVFAVSFTVLFLIWMLSCVICTCFVNVEKPCIKQNPIFRFYSG